MSFPDHPREYSDQELNAAIKESVIDLERVQSRLSALEAEKSARVRQSKVLVPGEELEEIVESLDKWEQGLMHTSEYCNETEQRILKEKQGVLNRCRSMIKTVLHKAALQTE